MVSMPRAALYLRISQDRSGLEAGVQRQRQDCEALAASLGWDVVGIYQDNDVSAYSRKPRPEFERLLRDVALGQIDAVIAWAADRLYRRLTDLERIVDALQGVEVAMVKSGRVDLSTADGRYNARNYGNLSQHESEKKSERVKAAAEQRARAGGYGGGARRMGFTKTADDLVPDEADAIREAYLHVAGGGSLESIAKDWRARFDGGPKGGYITGVQVRDVLLRPMNAGIATYLGEEVGRTKSPAIIDEDTFRTVRAILTDPKRRTRRGRPSETLLSGIMRCRYCGRPVAGSSRDGGTKRERVYTYACRARCVSRRRHRMDELISELVLARLQRDPEGFIEPPTASKATANNSAAVEAEKMRDRLDALAQLFAAGELEAADYAAATKQARARLAELETKLAALAGTPNAARLLQSGDVSQAWEAASMAERRAIIREVIDHIVVGRGTSGKFSAGDLEIVWRGSE